eukprot:c15566_g1_i1.p1 GENE.c15566_g1_i1~~c15566_g1_i1.p1  ORF type:complete len:409 (-),score=129.80 c15566_g1_i1:19-1224(-)
MAKTKTSGNNEELREKLKLEKYKQRQQLTLLKSPLLVLYHFMMLMLETFRDYGLKLLKSKFLFVLVPLSFIWAFLTIYDGSWTLLVKDVNTSILFAFWWFILGVASSIGLGTGMHSGLLFLFPHIYKVCRDSDLISNGGCGHTGFDSRDNMWWLMKIEDPFPCDSTGPEASFLNIFVKVFFACMFWGTGTAVGEIPPYAVSRAARLAGESDKEFEELVNSKPSSSFDVVGRMKVWMVNFLKKHGFIGVFLMSAWPNAFFDLCGICCGHFLMPFWSFFIACWVGKALVKVNLQSIVFITIFRESSRAYLLHSLQHFLSRFGSSGAIWFEHISEAIHTNIQKLQKASDHDHSNSGSKSIFAQLWGYVVFLLIGYFFVSCVEQLAKQRQQRIDNEQIEKRFKQE